MTPRTSARLSADWALAHGQPMWQARDLAGLLGVPPAQLSERLREPVARGEWVTPARGLWVAVAPEYRAWGAPPGLEVVDGLAQYLGIDYYVGWLTAAEIHGVAHQAPQVFHVATSRPVRERRVGRTRFTFHVRAGTADVPTSTTQARSGDVRVSTPERTALDLAADVSLAGGLDNLATVLVELAGEVGLDQHLLVEEASRMRAVVPLRRLGWLLEQFGAATDLDELRPAAAEGPSTAARLDPRGDLKGRLDRGWNVRVNADVEPDL